METQEKTPKSMTNEELIRAFLPEEMLDSTIESIRKSILVETKTSITLDYDTEKEE